MATTIHYLVACVAVLAFTGWNRGVSRHAFGAAILLANSCAITNALNYNLPYPEALAPYPLIDLAVGFLVAVSMWSEPRIWKALLSATLLMQCARHAIFWWGQAHGEGYEAVAPYMDNLSDILNIQLALVCIPGGISVVRQLYAYGSDRLMRMLSRSRRSRGVGHSRKAPLPSKKA